MAHWNKKHRSSNKPKTKEEDTHQALCNYIRLTYPDVIFLSDGSGVRMAMHTAKKFSMLKSGRGIPDLIILEPKGNYCGLLIEIKRPDQRVFLKNGDLSKDKHIREQAEMLDKLKHKGYATYFGIGLTMCIDLVDDYMKLELNEK